MSYIRSTDLCIKHDSPISRLDRPFISSPPPPITKFWTCPNQKSYAADKLNVVKIVTVVFDRVENIVGKR